MVNLSEIIIRAKKVGSFSSDKYFAEILGISAPDFSKRKKSGTLLPLIIDWGIAEKVNMDWLLTGETSTNSDEESLSAVDSSNDEEISDAEIIKQFSNRKYARELNFYLAQLENHYPETFREISGFIKGLLHRSDLPFKPPTGPPDYTGLKRRVAERRVKDDLNKIPGGKDRRSGKDRRAGAKR